MSAEYPPSSACVAITVASMELCGISRSIIDESPPLLAAMSIVKLSLPVACSDARASNRAELAQYLENFNHLVIQNITLIIDNIVIYFRTRIVGKL